LCSIRKRKLCLQSFYESFKILFRHCKDQVARDVANATAERARAARTRHRARPACNRIRWGGRS
jgi:hypothetical protein